MENQIGEVLRIDWRLIKPFEEQPRKYFDQEELVGLKDSIEAVGQVTPAHVCRLSDDPQYKYELIDGERRYLDCKVLDRFIEAIVIPVKSKEEQYLKSVVANFGRVGHTPLETARAIERIRLFLFKDDEWGDKTAQKLAKIFGHKVGWVNQHRALLKLHPSIQERMEPTCPEKRRINFQVAMSLANLTHEAQLRLVQDIEDKSLNFKHSLNYIRIHGGEFKVTKKGRRPWDDYQILTRFLSRLGSEAEALLDIPQSRFENMFRNRQIGDLRSILQIVAERKSQLELLESALSSVEKERSKATRVARV